MSVSTKAMISPLRTKKTLPQSLAFAAKSAVLRQDILVRVNRNADILRDLDRVVARVRINQHDFIQQRVFVEELVLDGARNVADSFCFVERRQSQADREVLFSFRSTSFARSPNSWR